MNWIQHVGMLFLICITCLGPSSTAQVTDKAMVRHQKEVKKLEKKAKKKVS